MDTTQYLDVFIDESTEHLDVLYKQLLELENNPSELTIIEEIFRAAHTLKGMSATMGYEDLANLTHKLENIFDGIRNEEISVNADMMDILFEAVDALNEMVADVSNGGDGKKDILKIANALAAIENGEEAVQESSVVNGEADQQSTHIQAFDEFELSILRESAERDYFNYEITVSLREDCLLKGARTFMVFEVLEKLGEVIKSEPPVQDLEEENFDLSFTVIFVSKHDKDEIKANIDKVSEIDTIEVNDFLIQQYQDDQTEQVEKKPEAKKEVKTKEKKTSTSKAPKKAGAASTKTIRVNIDRLDVLMNLFEELVVDRGRLEQISDELSNHDLQETVERMTRISGDLQNVILNMRMVPIDQVFSRFPSMMRSLSRDLNKEIIMNIVGADTELDRTVIDEIGDPLIHLLRNAVDHGLEKPEEREAAGKSKQGTIRLEAYHSGNHVFIEIEDDGKGINREAVLNKAIENGIVDEQEASQLPDQDVYELILASGFSTAEVVSDVSGRGVGLDVVKNTIESLGGNISINSEEGKGTLFSVQLPLTLSIISVMLVEIQKEKYAVPLSSIIETAIIKKEDILSARNKKVIDFRGHIVPLVFLKDLFQVPQEDEADSEYLSIVIVKKGDKMAGLVVDSFIGQQEVVLKSLGDYLTNVFAISGATILGNGQVALIIDGNALIK